jgi:hypothetical protein
MIKTNRRYILNGCVFFVLSLLFYIVLFPEHVGTSLFFEFIILTVLTVAWYYFDEKGSERKKQKS